MPSSKDFSDLVIIWFAFIGKSGVRNQTDLTLCPFVLPISRAKLVNWKWFAWVT